MQKHTQILIGAVIGLTALLVIGAVNIPSTGTTIGVGGSPPSDTSTSTNLLRAGDAYAGATAVFNGGQLLLSGGLSPARIAITNWNNFTNSILTNVITTVDGTFTLFATNGAAAGMWTNGASLVTCATNLATNMAGATFFGSTVRLSSYCTVVANTSNVLFYPLAKVLAITTGSVTNGATNLSASANMELFNAPIVWPTNTLKTTLPTLALGSYSYANSNGLTFWKGWNTNGSTVWILAP